MLDFSLDPGPFLLVTIVLGGGAAFIAGRAVAQTWRPWWQGILYMLILGAAEIQADVDRQFGRFPRLAERRNQLAGTLSGGEQQMLAIARALMGRPRLLLLDEPSLGLAPLIARHIFDIIKTLNTRDGLSVFLVEQNAYHALKLAHRGYVMVTGEIALTGNGRELLERPEVKAAYLEGGARMDAR